MEKSLKDYSNNIKENLFDELYLETINNGTDKKIVSKNIEIVFTSTNNQKINEDKNNVTMNLGHCENTLKDKYNISINDSLYIIQYIAREEGIKN